MSYLSLLYSSIPHRSVALTKRKKKSSFIGLSAKCLSRWNFLHQCENCSKWGKLQLTSLRDGSGFSTANIPFSTIITEGITRLQLSFRTQNKIFNCLKHAGDNLVGNIIKIQCKCSILNDTNLKKYCAWFGLDARIFYGNKWSLEGELFLTCKCWVLHHWLSTSELQQIVQEIQIVGVRILHLLNIVHEIGKKLTFPNLFYHLQNHDIIDIIDNIIPWY